MWYNFFFKFHYCFKLRTYAWLGYTIFLVSHLTSENLSIMHKVRGCRLPCLCSWDSYKGLITVLRYLKQKNKDRKKVCLRTALIKRWEKPLSPITPFPDILYCILQIYVFIRVKHSQVFNQKIHIKIQMECILDCGKACSEKDSINKISQAKWENIKKFFPQVFSLLVGTVRR